MGDIVIVAFRPKPGCEDKLAMLVRSHVPFLRELGLATQLAPTLMRGEGGVVVEVFEWREGGVEEAHTHPKVAQLWQRFAEVCTYETLANLPEAQSMFSMFKPL